MIQFKSNSTYESTSFLLPLTELLSKENNDNKESQRNESLEKERVRENEKGEIGKYKRI